LGRPPTSLATDVQRERLQTMEIRASKMHGSRAMPRGSVTTTHNRLRPNQAQVLPPIKTKPKPIPNRPPLKPTYSKRPPKQPKPPRRPCPEPLPNPSSPPSLSPPPTQSVGPPSQGGSHRRCSLGGHGLSRAPQRWGSTDPSPGGWLRAPRGLGRWREREGLRG